MWGALWRLKPLRLKHLCGFRILASPPGLIAIARIDQSPPAQSSAAGEALIREACPCRNGHVRPMDMCVQWTRASTQGLTHNLHIHIHT